MSQQALPTPSEDVQERALPREAPAAFYPWAPRAGLVLLGLVAMAVAISGTGIGVGPAWQWTWREALTEPFFACAALAGGLLLLPKLRKPAELVGVLLLGLALAAGALPLAPAQSGTDYLFRGFLGLGLAATIVHGVLAARLPEGQRQLARRENLVSLLFVLAGGLLPFFGVLTAGFRPLTLDAFAFAIDGALGLQPSAAVGALVKSVSALEAIFVLVYAGAFLAVGLVHHAQARAIRDRGRLLLDVLLIGALGVALHHVFPVAGPAKAFASFPELPPSVPVVTTLVDPGPRSSMPALPMAFAFALYFHARRLGSGMHAFGLAWLALTFVACLGLGAHFFLGLVIAFPTAGIAMALLAREGRELLKLRIGAVVVNAGLIVAWATALHRQADLLFDSRLVPVAAMLVTAVVPWVLQALLFAREKSVPEIVEAEASSEEQRRLDASLAWAMGAMFFVSGAAGLMYEVVFAKSLALTFGSTSRASTTVLATYMGGMAAGAWLGGRLARGRHRPLVVYALCEAGIALWCAMSPFMLGFVQRLYVALATGQDASAPWIAGLQVALGALVLLPPTLLMGITLPVVAKQFEKRMALGRAIGLLYGANTLGAALASFSTGYFILPFFGISRTTWLAVVANLSAVALALYIDNRAQVEEGVVEKKDATPLRQPTRFNPFEPKVAALVLFAGGLVTLALEVVYMHLLAIVAGNSTYAFSLMLFAFLLGLGGGAAVGRRLLQRREQALRFLATMQLGLASCILLGVYGWEAIPDYFASFAEYPFTRGFAARELVRGAICCMMMIPPALFIGAAYPLSMACHVEGARDPFRATGRASAINTVGNVLGAFVGSFVLVPYLGALRSLQVLACVACVLGIVAALACLPAMRMKALAPATIVALLLLVQPRAFDLNRLASGANVYFEEQGYGTVVDHAESADGGLTMVTELFDRNGHRVLTLLTNGKFQGDDSKSREMAAQHGFALFPLLHTTARDRALVIGFGTGVSARTVSDAGFAHTDIVDLSADIFDVADEYFRSVNAGVLHRPNVKAHVTDGRNFLLLTEDRYDLIGLEISSIWFAGAASLYNREFYQLVKSRLTERGVLQQWVQLHRLSPRDLGSIFASLKAEFEKVWLYFGAGQGVLVACAHDCEPTPEAIARIDATPTLTSALSHYGGRAERLLQSRLLGPSGLQAFIDSLDVPAEKLVSTDDNLFLEYSTPRGNIRPYGPSIRQNLQMLRQFQRP